MHSKKEKTTEKTGQTSIFRGLFYALLSGVLFSLVALIVKHVKNQHPGQLALYRFIAMFFMCNPETIKTRQKLWGTRKDCIFMMINSIVGTLGIFLNFVSFRYLGLGQANAIIFSSPACVTVLARIFFKEPCQILQTISVILTVIGIVFTSKLPSQLSEEQIEYSSEKIYGLLAAILSLFCMSIMTLITRKLRHVGTSILNFHFSWVGILEMSILTAVFGNFQWHQCGIQSFYIILLCLLSYSGFTLIVMALQCEYAGPVITVKASIDICLSFLFQIFIFHDVPDTYGIIGAILVLFCLILTGFNKWITTSQGNLLSCEKFKCL